MGHDDDPGRFYGTPVLCITLPALRGLPQYEDVKFRASVGSVTATGAEPTKLIVLRGNSASGKSTVAAEIRRRYGRGIAIVGQDNLRRVVLREHDKPNAANIGLIEVTARYALDHGFHVIIEGILCTSHYGEMLAGLCADHRGPTRLYYLHVPFEETLRRHATKPQAAEYGEAEMTAWYRELDLLPGGIEQIVPAETSLSETVKWILADTGLESTADSPCWPG